MRLLIVRKLASALAELDDEWRTSFLRHTKVINPNFVRLSFVQIPFSAPLKNWMS